MIAAEANQSGRTLYSHVVIDTKSKARLSSRAAEATSVEALTAAQLLHGQIGTRLGVHMGEEFARVDLGLAVHGLAHGLGQGLCGRVDLLGAGIVERPGRTQVLLDPVDGIELLPVLDLLGVAVLRR